jgi:AAA domain
VVSNVSPFPNRPPPRQRTVEPDADPYYDDRDDDIEPFEPFFASQMQGREPPPRRWLIDGVAIRGSVLMVAGAPKVGKSLLLQQLLTCTALGRGFLGIDCEPVRSLALMGEDPQDELERRQRGINEHLEIQDADLEGDYAWKSIAGQDFKLCRFDRRGRMTLTPKFQQVKTWAADHGMQVIGLDNARVFFGGSENDPDQVTTWLRALTQWALDIDGVIVLLTHPGKGDARGYAGSGAWLGSVRAALSLRRPEDFDLTKHSITDPRRVMAGLGSNYGPGIRTERIDIIDGVFQIADEDRRERQHQGPLTNQQRQDVRYHLVGIIKRYLNNGGKVYADTSNSQRGLSALCRRSSNDQINRVTFNDIELMQQEMLDMGQLERVRVAKNVLLRPADGPWYEDEQPWLPTQPPLSREAAD